MGGADIAPFSASFLALRSIWVLCGFRWVCSNRSFFGLISCSAIHLGLLNSLFSLVDFAVIYSNIFLKQASRISRPLDVALTICQRDDFHGARIGGLRSLSRGARILLRAKVICS